MYTLAPDVQCELFDCMIYTWTGVQLLFYIVQQ